MRIEFDILKNEIKRVFIKYGMNEDKAEVCANIHAESSRDGIYSHGANRVSRFVDYINKGWVDINATPTLEKSFGALATYNGNRGVGILNSLFCTDKAIELAKENGIGMVGLRNTTHWMRGGTYGLYAARKGYIAISWTNTESVMPPWGGIECRLGNNPFVMACPGDDGEPVMIDMAMSQYAYGKLQVLRQAGEQLPFPGGFDSDGNITSDPGAIEKTRRILPMGYWKGASFAFMLDILAAVMTDGNCGADINSSESGSCGGASQVFIVIDPTKMTSDENIKETILKAKKHIKESELAEGTKAIYYPGEDYAYNKKINSEKGVFIDDGVWHDIESL